MDTFSRPPWNERYESREEVRKYFSNFLGLDNFLGFVGTIGENLVALCVGMRKPWLKGTEYYVDQFCVAHACQRKGIGSLFLHEIEKQLTDREIKGILLNTERNYPAHDFYRKNGFTTLARRHGKRINFESKNHRNICKSERIAVLLHPQKMDS